MKAAPPLVPGEEAADTEAIRWLQGNRRTEEGSTLRLGWVLAFGLLLLAYAPVTYLANSRSICESAAALGVWAGFLLGPLLPGILLGGLAAGPGGGHAALDFLRGRVSDPLAMDRAWRFFAAAARAVLATGLIVGLAMLGTMSTSQRYEIDIPWACSRGPIPMVAASFLSLLLGRILLGTLAEGAARHSPGMRRNVYSLEADLGLLVFLAIPMFFIWGATTPRYPW